MNVLFLNLHSFEMLLVLQEVAQPGSSFEDK